MEQAYTLVTGASSGFGRSIAQKLAPHRKLILVGRDAKTLEAVRNTCVDPLKHLLWVRDLSKLDGLADELISRLTTNRIRVEHYVHSAGISSGQQIRAFDMAMAAKVFNVNLFSAMEIIRPLVQKRINMEALRSITLISSISSKVGSKGFSVYCASKGALDALTRSLAVELAPKVRVNSVLPGTVNTGMTKELFNSPDFIEAHKNKYPLGLGCPEDVADAVEFLSSDQARWITGQAIVVDGGKSITD